MSNMGLIGLGSAIPAIGVLSATVVLPVAYYGFKNSYLAWRDLTNANPEASLGDKCLAAGKGALIGVGKGLAVGLVGVALEAAMVIAAAAAPAVAVAAGVVLGGAIIIGVMEKIGDVLGFNKSEAQVAAPQHPQSDHAKGVKKESAYERGVAVAIQPEQGNVRGNHLKKVMQRREQQASGSQVERL